MRVETFIFAILSLILLSACASHTSGQAYPPGQSAYDVDYGEVIDVRVVVVEGEAGVIGTWAGASAGRTIGVLSSSRARTRILGGAVGGIAGAIAGRAIERKIREEEALEITIELDDGDAIAVVQADDLDFELGDRVRVLRSRNGAARVTAI